MFDLASIQCTLVFQCSLLLNEWKKKMHASCLGTNYVDTENCECQDEKILLKLIKFCDKLLLPVLFPSIHVHSNCS